MKLREKLAERLSDAREQLELAEQERAKLIASADRQVSFWNGKVAAYETAVKLADDA